MTSAWSSPTVTLIVINSLTSSNWSKSAGVILYIVLATPIESLYAISVVKYPIPFGVISSKSIGTFWI